MQIGRSEDRIPGLTYIADYLDAAREAALIQQIDQQPWITDLKRRVQHYGYRYDYRARDITPDLKLGDIPAWLMPVCEELHRTGQFPKVPDQVIVNEYAPGQGIAPHVDVTSFDATIASLSLGSTCVMEFTRGDIKTPLLLEPRSLVILSGEARYQWKHSIPARKTDKHDGASIPRSRRISLTFRNVRLHQPGR